MRDGVIGAVLREFPLTFPLLTVIRMDKNEVSVKG